MRLDPQDTKTRKRLLQERPHMCARCKRTREPNELEVSHFYRRSIQSVRHDSANLELLCRPCHQIWEYDKHPDGHYYAFKMEQLGAVEFDALARRAQINCPSWMRGAA
jgi:hypothetical protein